MTSRRPARKARRSQSPIVAVLVAVSAALIGVFGVIVLQSAASSTCSAASPIDVLSGDHHGTPPKLTAGGSEADGAVPDGVTVFDDGFPALTNLRPDLLSALRRAATDAANDGVELHVNSGWRSPQYQEQLFDEAVSECGSTGAAARWVATPDTSAHVSGDAVDIGPSSAASWLLQHGAGYGLCQIYGNEPWHYELRLEASDRGCPAMYADPTQDPRMQQ